MMDSRSRMICHLVKSRNLALAEMWVEKKRVNCRQFAEECFFECCKLIVVVDESIGSESPKRGK